MNFYEILLNRGAVGEGMTHFERLFAQKIGGGVKELSGVPPLTFKANGQPLIDWSIKGQTVQASTPTPSSPVDVNGVGEKTGNLFEGDLSQFDNQGGTGSTYQYFELSGDFVMTFTAKNACTAPTNTFLGITNNGGNASGGYTWGIEQDRIYSKDEVVTLKSTDNDYQFVSFYRGSENFEWILANFTIMLNTGSTALPFEPFGYKIPITCGGQITNIYLGSATSTRRVKKLVLTGEETSWGYNTQSEFFYLSTVTPDYLKVANVTTSFCSHYKSVAQTTDASLLNNGEQSFWSGSTVQRLYIKDTTYTSIESLKQYLAQRYANGTPVTVWYVLATPETAATNEPLMKIGSYADEISKTSTGVNIPTVSGSNTLAVNTTVQPSNMYIKYHT